MRDLQILESGQTVHADLTEAQDSMSDKSLKALEAKFKDYFAIGEAVAILMHPFAEVVLHDLASGRIVKMWNAFSNRRAGGLSHLEGASDLFTDEDVLGPYEKALPSQGRTKSITAALRDADGKIIGYFCVNLEITVLDDTVAKLLAFTEMPGGRPKPLYLNDLEQQISLVVRDYLLSIHKTLDAMNRQERVDLIGLIDDDGLFNARNAIRYVAKALGISRASVYNHLAEAKAQREAGVTSTAPTAGYAVSDRLARANAIASAQAQAETPPKARGRKPAKA